MKIGAIMTIAGPVSMTIPSRKNRITIANRNTDGEEMCTAMNAEMSCGARRSVKTLLNAVATARMKHRGA